MRRPKLRRAGALALLVLVVVLGHALLIAGWPIGRGDAWRRGGVKALQTRQLVAPAALPEAAPTAPTADPDAPGTPALPPVAAPLAAQAEAGAASAASAAAPAQDAGGVDPPRYPASVPPAATLHYRFQRGGQSGEGQLVWRPDGERYELLLQGLARGTEALGWSSRGRVGELGLEPERFVARRRGRDSMAVNFERSAPGHITFSGPALALPLLPGVQDRVSWMVQLAAIVHADASLTMAGRQISLWVVGPRADAEVWTFTTQAHDRDTPPAPGLADTVHLVREPRRPYDVRAEVWLDTASHHLPVRVRLRVQPSGESTEFVLTAVQAR